MDVASGIERLSIVARAKRLAHALVTTHVELDALERDGGTDPGGTRRSALHEQALDLATLTALLPRTHTLRLAAEHAARTVEEWALQPVGTEDARAGSLSMVIAMSLLRRTLTDTDRALAA
jgi:hypothetical protein